MTCFRAKCTETPMGTAIAATQIAQAAATLVEYNNCQLQTHESPSMDRWTERIGANGGRSIPRAGHDRWDGYVVNEHSMEEALRERNVRRGSVTVDPDMTAKAVGSLMSRAVGVAVPRKHKRGTDGEKQAQEQMQS